MTDTIEPIVVGADLIGNLDHEIWSFDGDRVLFHVEVMCSERVFTKTKDVAGLAKSLAHEVEKQLNLKIPKYDRGDRLSKETYSAFLRYRKELAAIYERHMVRSNGS